MKKITMALDPASIQRAADALRKYADSLAGKADEIDRRLSQEAADEAREHYGEDIRVEALEHGVLASGESVVFQEFGAGARISDPFPDGADIGVEIRRGSYSDAHGGEYAATGYDHWHYMGEEYRYVTPTNALFYGMRAAQDRAVEIAKEVLRE